MSFLGRTWSRLRGQEPEPGLGTQAGAIAAGAAIVEGGREDDAPADSGWSGDNLSGGSDGGGWGGFCGGGGGADSGGAGGGL